MARRGRTMALRRRMKQSLRCANQPIPSVSRRPPRRTRRLGGSFCSRKSSKWGRPRPENGKSQGRSGSKWGQKGSVWGRFGVGFCGEQ
jgi:hypothetical protein